MTDAATMPPLPVVTVVIPAFNAAMFLPEAIRSIQQQSLSDWELILVDDGSTDGTAAAADQMAGSDTRIRLVRLGQNQGIARACNIAFDQARGQFIARLDADDLAVPHRLASQVAAFRDADRLAMVGSHARVFGRAEGVAYCTLGDANIKARLLDGPNNIGGSLMMVRAAFVRQHNIRFDEQIASAEDIDYAMSIMVAGGDLENVDEVLLENRQHTASFTASRTDEARYSLQTVRRRLLGYWYPTLDRGDIDLIVAMFFEPYPAHTEAVLTTVRAVDRLVTATARDFGQSIPTVHEIILGRLPKMAVLYRDHGLLTPSHLEAIRCFVAPETYRSLEALYP